MNYKLPVFFHIPKNAGTYTYNIAFRSVFLNLLDKGRACNLEVFKNEKLSYRLICEIKNENQKYFKMNYASWRRTDFNDLNFNDFHIYFVEVCDVSFNSYKEDIYKNLPDVVEPYEFLILRESYSRTQSLYSYIQSAQSSHENHHGKFGDMTFVQYLNSEMLEGGWLIRSFIDLPNEIPITQEHFEQVCGILDNMLVFDVKNVDEYLKKIFGYCYDIDVIKLRADSYKNKTVGKIDTPFESLDDNTKRTFLNQVKWDNDLYERYVY